MLYDQMTNDSSSPLKWTAQLKVTAADQKHSALQGDKISLPPSVLQQLLSASTATVVSEDALDDFRFPRNSQPQNLANRTRVDRHQNLPYPLTFRLVNAANGNLAYAGVREFTAEENEVGVSELLRQVLGIDGQQEQEFLTIHFEEIPKGTYARLRPLEAGYGADWKPLLESHLRNMFTTLTRNVILTIPSGTRSFRFLVDKFAPEGDAICIIDTDLEIDIEPLNEEQARETLKRRLESSENTSEGGDVEVGTEVHGIVTKGDYVDYTLKHWNRTLPVVIELLSAEELDLFISPLTTQQRSRPRENQHVFADICTRPRELELQPSNAELDGAEEIFISVHSWKTDGESDSSSSPFVLKIQSSQANSASSRLEHEPSLDEAQCENCGNWVPERTIVLHQSFCYRNNVLCKQCNSVFKKLSSEWKNHWHCPQDSASGDSVTSHQRHDNFFHTPNNCEACGYQTKSMEELGKHRTSTCPAKSILCRFCHLLVAQQGPEDLDVNEPEVILSGLTPHELSDGSRTTECHMCSKIVRLRDLPIHLQHHNLERLSKAVPRLCRNTNCGRTLDSVGARGEIKQQHQDNDIGLCTPCFGPLYNSGYDPDHRALRRRVERRYLTQFLTGCGNDYCRNECCKTARVYLGLEQLTSKNAMQTVKADIDRIISSVPLRFCTDEASQKRRLLANMLAAEMGDDGYDLPWTVAALEAEKGDLGKARTWLEYWAPTRAESH